MSEIEPIEDGIKRDARGRKLNHTGRRSNLEPVQKMALCRDLASGDMTRTELGVKYGLTQQGVSMFYKRNEERILDIRANMAEQFAGLPLARKENRLLEYERIIEELKEHVNSSHHEWSKAKMIALRSIAEELGQLPPRQTVTVVPVQHVIVGVPDDAI